MIGSIRNVIVAPPLALTLMTIALDHLNLMVNAAFA